MRHSRIFQSITLRPVDLDLNAILILIHGKVGIWMNSIGIESASMDEVLHKHGGLNSQDQSRSRHLPQIYTIKVNISIEIYEKSSYFSIQIEKKLRVWINLD
jgi:hypothetical protein